MKKIILLLGLLTPLIIYVFDIKGFIVGSTQLAFSIIWPGYFLSLIIWPDSNFLKFSTRISLIPILSLFIIISFSTLYWYITKMLTPIVVFSIIALFLILTLLIKNPFAQIKIREMLVLLSIQVLLLVFFAFFSSNFLLETKNIRLIEDQGSEFYVIDHNKTSDNVITISYGIMNKDSIDHNYQIKIIAWSNQIYISPKIFIRSGDKVTQSVILTLPDYSSSTPMDIFLFKDNGVSATPYRQLKVWIKK